MKPQELYISERLRLMGLASHDLKAPLHRIMGLSALLDSAQTDSSEERISHLCKIRRVVSDALDMINTISTAYRLEADLPIGTPRTVDLAKLVCCRVQIYSEVARLKKIQIELAIDHDERIAAPTHEWLLQVALDNLLSNAVKFSPEGRRILVRLWKKSAFAFISVRDHGPGIRPEDQALLFRPFQRLVNRPTAGETATGLGLYVVHMIMRRLRGRVELRSVPRRGTRLTLAIPLTL